MPDHNAPPPAPLPDGGRAVVVDVAEVDATIRFDVAARQARAVATVRFAVDGPGGRPALDLRQHPEVVSLDGRRLGGEPFPRIDLGAGSEAGMRVLDADLPAGGTHTLEVGYCLGRPAAEGTVEVDWRPGGLRWDLWMSDLHPGRYLEMWVPAPLCHDRFALTLHLELEGAERPHSVVTNGIVHRRGEGWTIRFPASFTSLSPMVVVAPADEIEERSTTVRVPGRADPIRVRTVRHVEVDADLASAEADTAAWLAYLSARYGPWAHGGDMTVFVWGPGRGMEYDGATTASLEALEHEVFHSWFGRGVKPARAADGWIDEAWTSWATSTRRSEEPRFAAERLGLDADPVTLYPHHPWARHTPRDAYTAGARLFSGIAAEMGGPGRLRSAMGAWYRANAGGLVTTGGLAAHLQSWCDSDLKPLWERYAHGRG